MPLRSVRKAISEFEIPFRTGPEDDLKTDYRVPDATERLPNSKNPSPDGPRRCGRKSGCKEGVCGWTLTPLLDFQRERVLIYFLYFLLGTQFYRRKVFDTKIHVIVLGGIATLMLGSPIPSVWKYLILAVSTFVVSNIIVSLFRRVGKTSRQS